MRHVKVVCKQNELFRLVLLFTLVLGIYYWGDSSFWLRGWASMAAYLNVFLQIYLCNCGLQNLAVLLCYWCTISESVDKSTLQRIHASFLSILAILPWLG